MTAEEIHVLHHSLGLTRGREPYRNHFVTGEGSTDWPHCMSLVDMGFMVRHAPNALYGGDYCFVVTDAGTAEALRLLPPQPVLTRSQQRYRRFLNLDGSITFREFLALYYPGRAT